LPLSVFSIVYLVEILLLEPLPVVQKVQALIVSLGRCNKKLEAQWAEPVSLNCRTNQKQELPMAARFVNPSGRNFTIFIEDLP